MTERKTGGWLSSVVGNISGFWSRSPTESAAAACRDDRENSSRNISYEEQAESDVCEEDDGVVIERVLPGPSVTVPTTSRNQTDVATTRRTAPRYLSPSTLSSATRPAVSSDRETLLSTTVNRKRTATSSLFLDDPPWFSAADTSAKSSMTEPLSGGFFTKRSRIQRDFTDEKPFLSPSLFDSEATERRRMSHSFASSFTRLNSSMRSNVSHAYSTASSSLSSKTRAILEQLEKISSPAKEVKRLTSFNLNEPERWASDAFSSAAQNPPRNSQCSLSRAQLISNILATKTTSPFWSRPTYSAKATDSTIISSQDDQPAKALAKEADRGRESDEVVPAKLTLPLSKKADLLGKSESEKNPVDTYSKNLTAVSKAASSPVSSSTAKSPGNTALRRSSSSVRTINIFTARMPELGVVSPVKEKTRNGNEKEIMSSKIDGAMFAFTPPVKRGPSVNAPCEETSKKISHHAGDETATATSKSTAQKATDAFPLSTDGHTKYNEDSSDVTNSSKQTQSAPEKASTVEPSDTGSSTADTFPLAKLPYKKSPETWNCPECMVFNKLDAVKCICCGYKNNRSEAKPWTCSECWVSNKANDDKCATCGNAKQSNSNAVKPEENSQNIPTTNVFGDRTFKPVTISKGVSFGFSAAKQVADDSVSSVASPAATSNLLNSDVVVNGSTNKGTTLKFGLTSSASTPNFGFGKAPATSTPLAAVTEAQSFLPTSSLDTATALSFGTPSTSSIATATLIPPLTQPSLSFPTLTTASVPATTASIGSTFSFPISTGVSPFTFGSSSTSIGETPKAPTAPLFTFGSSTSSAVVTNAATAVTTTAQLPSFGSTFSTLPAFSTPKAPIFGASDGLAANPGGQDAIEMCSPTTSPATSTTAAFGMSKSSTAPQFSFGAGNSSSGSSSTGGLFGNLQKTTQNPLSTPSAPLFSFGQQQPQNAPKPFEPPASLSVPPATFNFGGSTSNGGAGFVFGSTAPPPNFTFGAQQPASSATSAFSFASAAPAFGTAPGSAPNFFSVGSTSSTTSARKMLKARRTRK